MKRAAAVLFLALLAAACSDHGSVAQPPMAPSSTTTLAPVGHVVSGMVVERTAQGARPIEGALVGVWVQTKDAGFGFGQVSTDAAGRYQFAHVPNGFIVLTASKNSGYDLSRNCWNCVFDQPCAATVPLSADAAVDLELVSSDSPSSSPPMGGSPSLSGVVFETTSEGRRPVPGARISWGGDLVFATTTSDAAGRYALCRLPTSDVFAFSSNVAAVKTGYALTNLPIPFHGDTSLDLEMKR